MRDKPRKHCGIKVIPKWPWSPEYSRDVAQATRELFQPMSGFCPMVGDKTSKRRYGAFGFPPDLTRARRIEAAYADFIDARNAA